MTDFSATDVALEGFKITRERPVAVLVWAAVEFIYTMVTFAIMAVMAGPAVTELVAMSTAATPDPQAVFAKLGALVPVMLVLAPVGLVFQAVVMCAFFRVVLRPGDKKFYYLAFGMDEVKVIAAMLVLYLLYFGLYFVALFVFAVPFGILSALGIKAAAGLLAVLGVAFVIGALVYGAVRLSLFLPHTFFTGKIDVKRSWQITRGRFWVLLGVYFMAVILAILVYLLGSVFSLLLNALSASQWVSASDLIKDKGLTLEHLIAPLTIAATVLFAFFAMLMRVIMYLPAPAAYAALKDKAAG